MLTHKRYFGEFGDLSEWGTAHPAKSRKKQKRRQRRRDRRVARFECKAFTRDPALALIWSTPN